jgi:cyclase
VIPENARDGRARSSRQNCYAAVLAIVAACWVSLPFAQPAPDGSVLETIQIRPNVFVIFGAGGNITAHVGEDGVVLVDSGTAEMADGVLEAVETITDRPIRMIINTSADVDHAGGNQTLAAAGVPIAGDAFAVAPTAAILAHENVLLSMAQGGELPYEDWPTESYTSRYRSMYINGDAVVLMRQLGAHTGGDSIVHFRRADVIATGDILDLRQFPVIDPENGGSIQGELAALNHLLDITVPAMPFVLKPDRTLVVPGHGYISDYAEVVEYQYMLTVIHDRVKDLVDKGMTLEQVIDANPTLGFRSRFGSDSGPWTTDMFVGAIYHGLKSPSVEQ